MTTIKITDGPDDEPVRVEAGTYDGKPGIWISLPVEWLSPSKAREVIAALQAAVDEVETPECPSCTLRPGLHGHLSHAEGCPEI